MNGEHNIAVVLAAGSGKRMNSNVPKQYMEINGKPLLYYSLAAFETCEEIDEIILVTGENDIDYCREHIIERYAFRKIGMIISGGKERYNSVEHALKAIRERNCTYVLIHDGARPLLTYEVISANLESVRKYGSGCTGVPVKDTIKQCDEDGIVTVTLPRNTLWQVQTPQTFSYSLIVKAYEKIFTEAAFDGITDDAMILEKSGLGKVHMVMGDYENIKVTTPEDLIVASHYLKKHECC